MRSTGTAHTIRNFREAWRQALRWFGLDTLRRPVSVASRVLTIVGFTIAVAAGVMQGVGVERPLPLAVLIIAALCFLLAATTHGNST